MKPRAMLLVLVSPTLSWAQDRPPLTHSVDIHVPAPPVPARIEVLDGDRRTRLSELRDSALLHALGRPGGRPDLADRRIIGPGMRAVVCQWIALDEAATLPRALAHGVELELIRPEGRARIPGRFAIDGIELDDEATRARGDRSDVTDWHGYGAEVLAVADGLVTGARDDIANDTPVSGTQTPIPLENASCNYVTLRLGEERDAFHEHLKPGSIRVRTGDRVTRGQVIGLLGNSGSSSAGPHLHFHVSDANSTLAAEGMPYVFRSFQVVGAFDTIDAVCSDGRWMPVPRHVGGARTMELPAANTVVRSDEDAPAHRTRSR